MPKKKLKLWVLLFLCLIFTIGIFYYSYEILIWFLHTNQNHTLQKEIQEKVIISSNSKGTKEYEIDFKTLKEMNPDTIAYIEVNNTSINYLVVKGKDNDYYLKHNFEKKWNVAGWIFGDYRNTFDEKDKNRIIYGHSIKDGSMFETLKNVLKKEWQENTANHIITLVTEQGPLHYQVFSTYSIDPEEYYIKTSFQNDKEYRQFLNKLQSRSEYNYQVDISDTEQILTLSSCMKEGKKRVVLHASLIKEEVMENG